MRTAVALAVLALAGLTAAGVTAGTLLIRIVAPGDAEGAAEGPPQPERRPGGRRGGRNQQVLQQGRALFRQYCARCHGFSAQGKIGPSLIDTRLTRSQIEMTIRQGPSLMPAFGRILTSAQIEAVADYVWSLGPERQRQPQMPAQQVPPTQPSRPPWPMCPMMRMSRQPE